MSPFISVILPVYNVEKYLPRCLDSLAAQTFAAFEVIAVNDGTTDGCLQILQEYASKDPRIKVFCKPNGGLSDARNFGLDRVSGQYVAFVDSDDFVHPDYLDTLLRAAQTHNADIACCDYFFCDESGQSWASSLCFGGDKVIDLPACRADYICRYLRREVHRDFAEIMVWNKLFRTAFLREHQLRFAPNDEIFAEDLLFELQSLTQANALALADRALYFYTQRADSIMGTYKPDLLARNRALFSRAERDLEKAGLLAQVAPAISSYLFRYYPDFIKNEVAAGQADKHIGRMLADPWLREKILGTDAAALTRGARLRLRFYQWRLYRLLVWIEKKQGELAAANARV